VYLLQNPVRAGIVHNAEHYIWSSASYYFSDRKTEIVDAEFVNQLFETKGALFGVLDSSKRLRGELLVQLKDRAGLKYKEIAEMDIFARLSFTSLGSIYRNIKKAHHKKVE
jgi:hypothetical protein